MKKRGLGRGLDALLSSTQVPSVAEAEKDPSIDLRYVDVELIERGAYQPRVHFDEDALNELAESIKSQGVVQPIVLRKIDGNRYELIAGERRWRAAQRAMLGKIPAVVRDLDDRQAAAISLIENIQRQQLNPLEEARALDRLLQEFEMTQQEVATMVGRSRPAVANLLRLLDLNEEVKNLLENRDLEMGHARAMLALEKDQQLAVALKVVAGGLSVRETEELVRRTKEAPKAKPAVIKADPDVQRLETELSDRLGAPLKIQYNNKGKGKLTISYASLEQLDGLLRQLRK